jgi:3-phosphoshikimate 1-carboxyvinyltransferase
MIKTHNEPLWDAPFRKESRVINATIEIPGSKSVTNRALILAALASTPSTLRKPLHSRDSRLMIAGLRALGVEINEEGNGDIQIIPHLLHGPAGIDVGNAGTVMRFLPPVAALAQGLVHFDGDPRSHERPLGPVIKALEDLGVTIEHNSNYRLPITINGGGGLVGGSLSIDATSSSQFISALLLIGPRTEKGITITHTGKSLPSQPHIEMTLAMLEDFGASVSHSGTSWSVMAKALHGCDITIEPDLSNAAPFMAAAMILGGKVRISHWPQKTTQPGDQLREIFTQMGGAISFDGDDLLIQSDGEIHGIDIDLHDVGELTPSIAAVAALADSPSHLRGIGHLRLHETDRLHALTTEINSLGGNVVEEESSLRINPAPLHSGIFHTYDDHRLATAGAIIGLAVAGIQVENISTTQKTLPDFPGLWMRMLGDG